MKKSIAFFLFVFFLAVANAQVKALVGGTLLDGYGGTPIQNSVILIEGERIVAVGHQGNLEVPEGAEVISTEGMTVLPGLWDMHVHLMINGHSDYAYWDRKYPPLLRDVIMPASRRLCSSGSMRVSAKKPAAHTQSSKLDDASRDTEFSGQGRQ